MWPLNTLPNHIHIYLNLNNDLPNKNLKLSCVSYFPRWTHDVT